MEKFTKKDRGAKLQIFL